MPLFLAPSTIGIHAEAPESYPAASPAYDAACAAGDTTLSASDTTLPTYETPFFRCKSPRRKRTLVLFGRALTQNSSGVRLSTFEAALRVSRLTEYVHDHTHETPGIVAFCGAAQAQSVSALAFFVNSQAGNASAHARNVVSQIRYAAAYPKNVAA
jgi:hypothetical protein